MKYFEHSHSDFVYKYIVTMSDVDIFRHMSYANYIKLLFLASDAFLLSSLTPEFLITVRIKATKTEMDFKYQTKLGDHVIIRINSCNISKNSFCLRYTFTIENTETEIGFGRQLFELDDLLLSSGVLMPEMLQRALGQIQVVDSSLVRNNV